jgi:hypothetical protein
MSEENSILIQTHDKIFEIFNKVKNDLGFYPEYFDFKKWFMELMKQSFPRIEEDRRIEIPQEDYFNQEFYVDFIVNTIPVKLTEDIHGIRYGIMRLVLSRLSCRFGIIINIVDSAEPKFEVIQNQ